MERVLFNDGIGPREIRQLFGALNQDGRLDRLKPYFTEPSDASLTQAGELFTEFFFRRALEKEGFPSVLTRHTVRRDFSALDLWFKKQSPILPKQVSAAVETAGFRELLPLDYRFFSPDWADMITQLVPNGFGFVALTELESQAWAKDFLSLLKAPELEGILEGLAGGFGENQLGPGLIAFAGTFNEAEQKAFAASVAGLSRDAKRPLEKIAPLFESLQRHPVGLLTTAFDKLDAEADIRSELANLLFSQSYDAVSAAILKALATQSVDTQTNKFIVLRTAIEEIAGKARGTDSDDYLLANMPIYLPTLAFTLWLEEIAKAPDNKLLKDRLYAKKSSPEAYKFILVPPDLDLDIFVKKGDAMEVNPVVEKALTDLELKDFLAALKKIANTPGLGNFRYQIKLGGEMMNFTAAVEEFCRQLESTRSFGDSTVLARVFLRRLMGSVTLRDRLTKLDKEDWLEWLHAKVLDPDLWPTVHQVLFSNKGLLAEEGDTKRIVLSLFEGRTEYKTYLEKLFADLPVLLTLDKAPAANQRSLFSFYLDFNTSLGKRERSGLIRFITSLSKMISLSQTKAVGPLKGLSSVMTNEKLLSTTVSFLGDAGRAHPEVFFAPFGPWKTRGPQDAVLLHFNLVKDTLGALDFREMALLIQNPIFDFASRDPFAITWEDYWWLSRLVERRGWTGLYDFFRTHSSRRTLGEFLAAVQALETSGYLSEVISLMQRIQDERTRAFAAALQTWQQSGELNSFLKLAQTLVRE